MKKDNQKTEKVVVGPNFLNSWFVYDFEVCVGVEELKETIKGINSHGYDIVSVTQAADVYTVFFRRRACG